MDHQHLHDAKKLAHRRNRFLGMMTAFLLLSIGMILLSDIDGDKVFKTISADDNSAVQVVSRSGLSSLTGFSVSEASPIVKVFSVFSGWIVIVTSGVLLVKIFAERKL